MALFLLCVLAVGAHLFPSHKDVARMHHMAGKAEIAVDLYRGVLREDPNDIKSLRALADLYLHLGNIREAHLQLRTLKQLEPEKIEHREALITFYYDNLMVKDMIGEREALVKMLEGRDDLKSRERLVKEYAELAQLHSFYQDATSEVSAYRKLLDLDPTNRDLVMDYIKVMLREQKKEALLPALLLTVERYPGDKELVEAALGIALFVEDFETVERVAEIAIQSSPEEWMKWLYYLQALKRGAEKSNEKLTKYVGKSLAAHKIFGNPVNLYDLTTLTFERQRLDLAKQVLDQWIANDPKNFAPWQLLIHEYAPRSAMPAAEQYAIFEKAMKIFSTSELVSPALAFTASNLKKWDMAERLWRSLLEKDDGKVEYHQHLLGVLTQTGKEDDFKTAIEAARKVFPGHVALLVEEARWHQHGQRWPEATAAWRQVVELQPEEIQYHRGYLVCLGASAKEEVYAKALQASLARFPDDREFTKDAAFISQDMRRWQLALQLWRKLRAAEPDEYLFTENLLYCLSNTSKRSDYADEIRAALKRFPGRPPLMQEAAYLVQEAEEWEEAAGLWRALIAKRPDDPENHANYLECLSHLPDKDKYAQALKLAVGRFPEDPGIMVRQAIYAAASENWAEAAVLWDRLSKGSPKSAQYLRELLVSQSKTLSPDNFRANLRVAAQRFPSNMALNQEVGYLAMQFKDWDTAILAWGRLRKAKPDALAYHQNLVYSLSQVPALEDDYRDALAIAFKRFPQDPALIQAAFYHFPEEKRRETAKFLVKELGGRKDLPAASMLVLADAYHILGDLGKAHELVAELASKDPENKELLVRLIRSQYDRKEYMKAIVLMEPLYRAEPENASYKALYRDLLSVLSEWDTLEPFLLAELAREPNNIDMLNSAAYGYVSAGQRRKAIPYFQRLIRLRPNVPDYAEALASIAIDIAQPELGIPGLERLLAARPEDIKNGIILAGLYQDVGRVKEATKLRRRLVALAQDDLELLKLLGAQFMAINELNDAAAVYHRVLELDSKEPSALRALGRMMAWSNAPADAMDLFHRYLTLVPNDATIRVEQANLYRVGGHLEISRREFKHALELLDNGGFAEVPKLSRAQALAGLDRMEEAMPLFAELLRENPDDGYLWGDYAEALVDNKKLDEGEDVLKRAPQVGNFYMRNRRLLARIHIERREYVKAKKVLEEIGKHL